MAFWKKKNYCKYCGSELKADGSCSNEKCIAYKAETTTASSSTASSSTATETKKE